MGFGGSVSAMINTIKNNKRELKSVFKSNYNLRYKKSFIELKENGCSKKQLEELRKQFRERKKHNKRVQKYLISFLILLTVLFFYFLFIY